MSIVNGYFRFERLSDEVQAANGINSLQRLDCVEYAGNYNGLTSFVNKKGQLFFYLTPAKDIVHSDKKRMAEWSLTKNSQNLSSIYIDDPDYPHIGYGYPNANRLLRNGKVNPMYDFRNDGFLFLIYSNVTVEILVIQNARNLIKLHYQKMIDGSYLSEYNQILQQTEPFFSYVGLDCL